MGPLAHNEPSSPIFCGILPYDPFLILNGLEGCVKLRGEIFDFWKEVTPERSLYSGQRYYQSTVDITISFRTRFCWAIPLRHGHVIIWLYDFA